MFSTKICRAGSTTYSAYVTTHALGYFLHALLWSLDHGDVFARVFFADFSKGFNLVDHSIQVQELQLLCVQEATICWISSFLSGRVQRVCLDGISFHTISPRGGIPQGTRLVPLLFAILVKNLCREWHNRLQYVDDTSVFKIFPRLSPSYLPFTAADINSFASEHNMKLNEKKYGEFSCVFVPASISSSFYSPSIFCFSLRAFHFLFHVNFGHCVDR